MAPLTEYAHMHKGHQHNYTPSCINGTVDRICPKGPHSVSMSTCVKTGAWLATLGLEVR